MTMFQHVDGQQNEGRKSRQRVKKGEKEKLMMMVT